MGGTFRYLSYEDTVKMDIRMADVVPVFEETYRTFDHNAATFHARVRLVNPPLAEGQGTGRPWDRDLRILPTIVPGLGSACRLGATARGHGGGTLLVYWDFETMALRCVISDSLVHGVRSAAPDGPLTKYLARADATVLASIGTGRIARFAVEAACSQRPIRTVRVYSRSDEHRREFCAYIGQRLGVETINCTSNDEAVKGAHVVVMSTSTPVPVINGAALAPGCTVISNTPEEFDRESVLRADRIVGTWRNEVFDHVPPWQAFHELTQEGRVDRESLTTISEVINGRKPGRTSDDEIIVCMNPGNGVHDAAAARFVYDKAVELGLGVELPT